MSNSDLFLFRDDDENCPLSFLEECRGSTSDQDDDYADHHHHDQDDHEVLINSQPDGDDDEQEIMTKNQEAKKKEDEEEEVLVLIPYDDDEEHGLPKTVASSQGGLDLKVETDDDNDGFKTPTSLDHKIPVRQQCPSAPKKPKVSLKRKAVPSSSRAGAACSLQLDFSEQIESMFPDLQCRPKIKKARRADQEAE